MLRPVPVAALLAACLLAAVGCKGSSPAPQAVATPADTSSPSPAPILPTCPPSPATTFTWPLGVPADLPRPPGATLVSHKTTSDGLIIVQFTTKTSLRDGVIFLVNQISKAGYALGRGDAEPSEADAPFSRGADVRGVYRIYVVKECQSQWLMAVTTNARGLTGTPLLPYRKGPSPSPLPFG